MSLIPSLIIIFIFLILIGYIISILKNKDSSSIKIILLGINITILGGILILDSNSNLGGLEYLISLFGLLISLLGFIKE